MKFFSRETLTLAVLVIALAAAAPIASAQAPDQQASDHQASDQHGKEASQAAPAKTPDAATPPQSPEAARQAKLIADTAKLYQLAQELKVEVDKSNKDTMSVAVIKKAAEVEILARDLKERLKLETQKPK